ncbi:hypothetical protein ACLXAZ_33155, partial [Escherichia coli]
RTYLEQESRFGLTSNPVTSIPVQEDWEQPGDRALTEKELQAPKMIAGGVTTMTNRVRSRLHSAFQSALQQDYNPRTYLEQESRFGLTSNPVTSIPVQEDWEQPGDRA